MDLQEDIKWIQPDINETNIPFFSEPHHLVM